MESYQGSFTISLDFELFWGMQDHSEYAQCEHRLLSTRKAIPQILAAFERHDIHATWATVGLLFGENGRDLATSSPNKIPSYKNPLFTPYRPEVWPAAEENETNQPGKFAASLIKLISQSPGQEIASHTYSHYYCLEEGQTMEQFEDDLRQAVQIAAHGGYQLRSLVFPRNQYTQQHLNMARNCGFTAVRVQDSNQLYEPKNRSSETLLRRLHRGIDAYIPLTGNNITALGSFKSNNETVLEPASRFLRPWSSSLAWLDPLHLSRIKHSMTRAAHQSKNFHIWWHPHNFGANTERNLKRLETILEHFAALRDSVGFQSVNMAELSSQYHQIRSENRRSTSTVPSLLEL